MEQFKGWLVAELEGGRTQVTYWSDGKCRLSLDIAGGMNEAVMLQTRLNVLKAEPEREA